MLFSSFARRPTNFVRNLTIYAPEVPFEAETREVHVCRQDNQEYIIACGRSYRYREAWKGYTLKRVSRSKMRKARYVATMCPLDYKP